MENTRGSYKDRIDRHHTILQLLETQSALSVTELSNALGISSVTIRKDLDELGKRGVLIRVHGGARRIEASQAISGLSSRMELQMQAKQRIAVAVANLVEDSESILIHSGSTSAYVCEALKQKKNLIVITNALHIFNSLSNCPNITLFFLGGRYNAETQTTLGDDVLEQLYKYKVDKLIMGMDGIDADAGCTSFNHVESSIMKQMILQAKEKILVADETKLGKVAFVQVSAVSDFDVIVTNKSSEKINYYDELRRTGIKLVLA